MLRQLRDLMLVLKVSTFKFSCGDFKDTPSRQPPLDNRKRNTFSRHCSIGIKRDFPFSYTLCNGKNIIKALTHESLIVFVVLPEVRNTAQVWRWCAHASHSAVVPLANSSGFHRPPETS